ncbi:MAG: deoxyhypusine synthase [Candidatus Methanofastidiosa archaeon]|nr:deoxyhypusine synthase [Candidatus Methanofastidiosa archaeon]MDD4281093.1 deoxyhypusine synthase [Candidatus Methanofastidiosa archaeon]
MNLEKEVTDFAITKDTSVKEITDQMYEAGGFTGEKVSLGVSILERMMNEECTTFLSFPACIISTGTRGIVRDLVRDRRFNVLVTTCGTLDHDLARIWRPYYHGYWDADDAQLHREGINRLGNIFIPNECYGGILEEKLQEILQELYDSGIRSLATYELVWAIGDRLDDEGSIVYWAAKHRIPVVIPGITDGSVGSQVFFFAQDHDFKIDILKDEKLLADLVFDAPKTGALMIGGGISKHHTIWWNQFRDGLDYAVYITTAPEWDGSLSGARVKEAVSWGKVKEDASYVTIEGEATVLLPLMYASLLQHL